MTLTSCATGAAGERRLGLLGGQDALQRHAQPMEINAVVWDLATFTFCLSITNFAL